MSKGNTKTVTKVPTQNTKTNGKVGFGHTVHAHPGTMSYASESQGRSAKPSHGAKFPQPAKMVKTKAGIAK